MAWSILFLAVLIFAFRGYFLSLPGVIGRVSGIICGYLLAFQHRQALGAYLAAQINYPLPALAYEGIAGVGLFFGSLLLISLTINYLCRLLAALIPALSPLLSKGTLTSRIGGAIGNSAIAVVFFLLGLWLYGLLIQPGQRDELQQVADRFGSSLFATAVQQYQQRETVVETSHSKLTHNTGSAVISSGNKTLSIEVVNQANELLESIPADQVQKLVNHDELQQQLQSALGDAEIQDMAQQFLRDNPEAIQEALQNPDIQKLIEQLQQR
jgi:hypothetical protein